MGRPRKNNDVENTELNVNEQSNNNTVGKNGYSKNILEAAKGFKSIEKPGDLYHSRRLEEIDEDQHPEGGAQTISIKHFCNLVKTHVIAKQMGIANKMDSKTLKNSTMNLWAVSGPGIGKSSQIAKVAKELGCGYRYIPGGSLQEGDIGGLTVYDINTKEIVKKVALKYFPKVPTGEEINNPNNEYNRPGFIFLDEMGDININVLKELLAFIAGNVTLEDVPDFSPNWFVVAAGNDAGSIGDDLYYEMPGNIRQKFRKYIVEPSYEDFMKYMNTYVSERTGRGFNPYVKTYLMEHKGDLNVLANGHANAPNPRNWEDLSDMINVIEVGLASACLDPADAYAQIESFAIGCLSYEVGGKFMDFYRYENKTISPEVFMTTDLATSDKYKTFNTQNRNIKLMTVYRSVDALASVKNDKDFSNKFKILQKNIHFLLAKEGMDFIAGVFDSMLSMLKDEKGTLSISSNDLIPEFKEAAAKSYIFSGNK